MYTRTIVVYISTKYPIPAGQFTYIAMNWAPLFSYLPLLYLKKTCSPYPPVLKHGNGKKPAWLDYLDDLD